MGGEGGGTGGWVIWLSFIHLLRYYGSFWNFFEAGSIVLLQSEWSGAIFL